MFSLVRMARRRVLHNELLCQGANAASAALAAVILLLVLGTQILSWYWAVLLPAAGVGVALYRVRRRMPSSYVVAQRVDRRLDLADTLSTAVYFSEPSAETRTSPEWRNLQLAEAERVAQNVDARLAVPYVIPQTAYVAAALLLVASSVFALRYGLTAHLDLKQPLASILRQRFGLGEGDQRARLDSRRPDKVPVDNELAKEDGQQANPNGDPDQAQQDTAENYAGEPSQPSAGKTDSKKNGQMEPDTEGQDQADQAEDTSADNRQNASNSKDGQKDGKDSQSGSSGDSKATNQSLLNKMKEAMQNLLSSMQQNQQQQQQNASNQNGKSGKGQQNQGKQQAQKGDKKNAQMNESQEQQAADEGEQAQNAQGQSSDKADSPLANKQPGSGAGNKDGAKDVKLAEQLAAMGKISEIIGKRSANVTGEATVDVQNTSQQLKTGYQERNAEHAQAGAEINRDEIPVALESYVEQYFEQVRKQPAGKK